MLNLDPNLLNQEEIRHKKRKRMLKIAFLPLVLMLLSAVFFLRTGIYNIFLAIDISNSKYDTSKPLTDFQIVGNLIDPSLAYYNRGTMNLLEAKSSSDLKLVVEDFDNSLKNNPKEERLCLIYTNYSYALEIEGDLELKEKNYNESIIQYNRAEALLYENGCAEKNSSGGKDELAKNAKERIDEKRKAAIDAANNVTEEDPEEEKPEEKKEEIGEKELREIVDNQESINDRIINGFRSWEGRQNGISENYFSMPRF